MHCVQISLKWTVCAAEGQVEAGIGASDATIGRPPDLLNAGRIPLGLTPLVDQQRADAFHKVGPGGAAVVHHAELRPEAVRQRLTGALSDLPQGHLLRQGRQPAPQRIQIRFIIQQLPIALSRLAESRLHLCCMQYCLQPPRPAFHDAMATLAGNPCPWSQGAVSPFLGFLVASLYAGCVLQARHNTCSREGYFESVCRVSFAQASPLRRSAT